MECRDSVSDDGASGPYTYEPPGFSSPTPCNQDEPRWRKGVEGEDKGQKRPFEEECELVNNTKQVDESDVDDRNIGDIEEENSENDENNGDELECKIEDIVYQADGSVYVLDSHSQLPSSVVPSLSRPPIISTCHFSSSQSSALKSFHVFHLHHPKNWCHPNGDIPALLARQSKDIASAWMGLSEAGQLQTGKARPILMCFLCRLSFSRTCAFRGHIVEQHGVQLSTEEQRLLSLQHTRAILQPVGPNNQPLLSFLEPKISSDCVVSTQLGTTTPGHNKVGVLCQEEREDLQILEPRLPLQPSLPRAPLPTSALSPAKDISTLSREGTQRSKDDDLQKDGGSGGEGEEQLGSEVICTAEDGVSSIIRSGRQEHSTKKALSNQSIPKSPNSVTIATSFMNNTKSLTDSECGTSFNCHSPASLSPNVQTSPIVTIPKEIANQESVMKTEPNDQSEKGSAMAKKPNDRPGDENKPAVTYSQQPSSHSDSPPPGNSPPPSQANTSQLEEGQADMLSRGSLMTGGDGGFVVGGRDGVQGSSYSFGGQIAMTHSRNSCKTLKCPKCNWHYKYQQTLEAHMKEKHPETEDGQCPYCSSGQSHPRLARGETYTCGYKPFRCQVCQYSTTTKGNLSIHMQSDKHLNNMQNLQTQTRPHAPTVQASVMPPHTSPTQASSPSPSKVQGRASWRCEVCDYETNVARNLRIHMTSEKHTHNMLLLQQNLAHMQRQRRHSAAELYRYCQPQSRLPDPGVPLPSGEVMQDPPRKLVNGESPEGLFECALCGRFSSDSLEELSQHLATQRSLPDADWRSTTGDAHHCRLCHYATPLRANFQLHCQTDKHLQRYQLAAHLQEASYHHGNPEEEEEWLLRCVAAGVQVQLRCNACNYEANSLEKLKLHTVNSRHEASLKLYKYLQEFEGTVADGSWLHCALCDFSTQNTLSLVQHSNSLSHQRGEGLFRLQQIQKGLQDDEEELGAIFKIRKSSPQANGDVNEMESPTEINADQEDQTKHSDREGEKTESSVHGEKRQSEPCSSPKRPLSASEERDDTLPPKRPRAQEEIFTEQVRQCPFCRYCHADIGRLRNHVMVQHAVQPTLRCPLCQDTLRSVALLRNHLTHLHSVTAECTQKLINTVIASDVLPDKMFLPVQDSKTQQAKTESTNNGTRRLDEQVEAEHERVDTCQPDIAKIQKHPLEDAESTKENTAAFPCWQKGCNKVLPSSSALQTHVNHFHSQRAQMPISDRHVYKYRCSQCSLAFKTAEKLQLHSQYHAIRAATMCCLCQRSFRTLQALRRHLETSHLELTETQLQQLCGSLLMTEDLLGSEDHGLGEASLEDERMKEDEESDPDEKISPTESDHGLEDVELNPKLPNPNSIMPQRKGPNLSTEKFLDPSRPFKCTVCKESFTQKNILLVHYNSVSHLHKVKRSVQDSSAGLPESVSSSTDHKPFKCSICNVAYSQSSTLEIHMRSVLHQTKARAAKLDSSGASSASVNPLLGKSVSLTGNTATSSQKALKNTSAMNIGCTSSAHGEAQMNHQQSTEHNVTSSSQNSSLSSASEESKKKQLVDAMATTTKQQHKLLQQQQLQQQQLAQAQAHIQQELQKNAALLQSHLFNPALLHHFPISTDTLLPLQQQQQLLLPFLIPGGEFQINPELNLKGSGLNLNTAVPATPEERSKPSQQDSHISSCKQPLNGDTASTSNQLRSLDSKENVPVPQQDAEQVLTSDPPSDKSMGEDSNNKARNEAQDNTGNFKAQEAQEGLEDEVICSGEIFTNLIPPRVAHDAPGNISKALLENIGFELVMHFNENKQQNQRNQADVVPNGQTMSNTKEMHNSEFFGKLECESCGKFFSNALILKSHKEHIHRSIFPIQSLEKFAKDYREHYDKLFPFRPTTPEVSPSSPSPTTPPPPNLPDEPTQQKTTAVSTPTVTPPAVSTQVPLAPVPLPLDLPLFPPLMMHPMPMPQIPVHLPPVETGLTPELAQLYQNQLTPVMMQQQGKRPRTRITDDQLRILRQYFDINNSPNEDQIQEMANKSGLPHKVIKHWFRNTLFKERQRNKDSPYNFSNPPITTLEDVKVDSRPSSPETSRYEYSGGKRSSRTKFTDYQLRVLQDFFDANAYPKDDEFEQLSNLLNLSTRVIVVWFQNTRQKARKNYENQGEGSKDSEHREISNDRYIRTSNNSYECKKCSMVFQRIFDLISHQKKVCYKDDNEEVQCDSSEFVMDLKPQSPSDSSSLTATFSNSSFLNNNENKVDVKSTDKVKLDPDNINDSLPGDLTQIKEASYERELCVPASKLEEQKPSIEEKQQASTKTCSSSPNNQHHQSLPPVPETSPVPSQISQKNVNSSESPSQQAHLKPAQPMTPYHCIQCKLTFPSFEHWQDHQQMHFLVAQNHFVPPQFLDRSMDIPLMLFDPSNPLLARQVLSGAFPQITASSAAIPDSTISSLKRKLEQKSGGSSLENDWENNVDDPQRDKRMRTTITPEQLEILYQKYLLDSNPTRQMLDHISQEVGLKKRVVQVWFQNTRARERKGQFRTLGPAQAHRRCPFCRALFKAQTALDAHIRSRHWHEAKTAGYSMAISGISQDHEGPQFQMDPFNFSKTPNPGESLIQPESPHNRILDLSPHQQQLSPRSLKRGRMDEFDGPTISSQHTFEQGSQDTHKGTSVHNETVIDEENYSEGKHNSTDQSCNSEREVTSENEDKMSSGLVSPAMSFSAKDFENDLVLDYSENSSLADPASPCPGGSNSQNIDSDRHGQKRYRTQLSSLQVKVLKACFSDYKTPTMLECEALGNDIGLAKRVVQVWFQNARAKEKKAKLSLAKQFGTESTCTDRPKTECTLCCVKYSGCLSVRDHVFSQQHLAKVKEALGGQMDRDKEYVDSESVHQLMTQQEMDRLKKASEILSAIQPQPGESSGSFGPQFLNPPTAGPVVRSSPPKLDSNGTPSNGLISRPNKSSCSSSVSATNDKDITLSSVLVTKTEPGLQLQFHKESSSKDNMNATEKLERISTGSATHSNSSISKEKQDPATSAASTQKPGKEYTIDPVQLQALQAAGITDQAALLQSPLLPCLMPGFPPIFPPQIPAALTGSFLQPMFGMEGMFPYSPVLPQALMGLSPGSLLQQYQHNLQGALMQQRLQFQQKQLLQQPQKPKASQNSTPAHSQDVAPNKEVVLASYKPEEKQGPSKGEGSPSVSSGSNKLMDGSFLISHCIVSKATCRERGKDVCLYDCLACETSLNGNEELLQHLDNPQHRQRAAEKLNAKEHASSLLPHISPSSTSQPNPPSIQKSSPAQSKHSAPESPSAISCFSKPTDHSHINSVYQPSRSPSTSTALIEDTEASCSPDSPLQFSLPSTVTSSLTGPAKSCHLKPTDSTSGCRDIDGSAEEQASA